MWCSPKSGPTTERLGRPWTMVATQAAVSAPTEPIHSQLAANPNAHRDSTTATPTTRPSVPPNSQARAT
jgi:hypothetical protein